MDESQGLAEPYSGTISQTGYGYSVADAGKRRAPPIPDYLSETYWWAYLHPRAVRVFEREWLVNLGQHHRHIVAATVVICQFNQLLTNDIKTSIKSAYS